MWGGAALLRLRHMTYDEYNAFCRSLPATTYIVQWNNSHVWKVGGKVFAIGGLGQNDKPAFIFKTSELNFYFLSELKGYKPAPYFASRGMKCLIAKKKQMKI